MLAIKIVREVRTNEIRPCYLKTSYLNVSTLPIYQGGIGFSQSCSTGTAPSEKHFWGKCREKVRDRSRQTLGYPSFLCLESSILTCVILIWWEKNHGPILIRLCLCKQTKALSLQGLHKSNVLVQWIPTTTPGWILSKSP